MRKKETLPGEKEQKPRYGMFSNAAWMIRLAFEEKEKKAPLLALLTAVLTVCSSLIGLYVTPVILGRVEAKAPLPELLAAILIFSGLLMLCSALAAYVDANILYGRIQVRLAIIARLNRKAATTSYPNLQDEKFRKLIAKASTATEGNSMPTEAVWGTLSGLAANLLGFIIYLVLLSALDFWMLLVILLTSLAGYFISRRLNEYGYRHREEVAEHEKRFWYLDQAAKERTAAKDIRIFNMQPWLTALGDKALAAYLAFHKKANGVYCWGRVADLVMTFLRNGAAYAYLIYLVLNRNLTAAQFLLYFSAVGGFAGWVTGILGNLNTLHKQSLDLSTVRECLEYPEAFSLDAGEPLTPDKNGRYEIRLEDVSFRYPGSGEDALRHINLTLHPGEKLAVVGLNGAGKTTLVRLICGFYDPTEGRVLLNGKDIREYRRRDYYGLFSAVFQDFSLLAESAAVNIAQTDENIDREKLRDCVEKAGLTEKIESLPEQYETKLNRRVYEDAVELSGGETQRLMLARALYKDAPIILLDEPTAALDPIAEADLYQKYGDMAAGRSSVYISHRLASTRFCDRILLIDRHEIAEEGTHEELLKKGGIYARLFEVQSRYYKKEAAEDGQGA